MHCRCILRAFRGRHAEGGHLPDERGVLYLLLSQLRVANPVQVVLLGLEMNLRVVKHARQHFVECTGRSAIAGRMAVGQPVDQPDQLLVLIIEGRDADAVGVVPDYFFEDRLVVAVSAGRGVKTLVNSLHISLTDRSSLASSSSAGVPSCNTSSSSEAMP